MTRDELSDLKEHLERYRAVTLQVLDVWSYLRQMGDSAPFCATPLPLGVRPDHQARQELGGF